MVLVTDTNMGIFIALGLVVFFWLIYYSYDKHRQYSFFVYYVGTFHATVIRRSGKMKYLFHYLNSIQISSNNCEIFDLAIATYVRRSSDEELFEQTKLWLYSFDSYFFRTAPPETRLDDTELRALCYAETKLVTRPDILRYLLWLVVINPQAIKHIDDL